VPELRVDPLNGLRTIIAPGRSERPIELVEPHRAAPCEDPFAAGNEDQTPPALYTLAGQSGAWQVRAFENLYPALDAGDGEPAVEAKPDLFTRLPASGAHEVIVNSNRDVASLADLTVEELSAAVDVWRLRMRAHENAACLHLSVNEGHGGGASIAHTHAQLYAFDFVPALIARERERCGAYATRTMGGSLLGDLVAEEVRRRERIVAIDDEAVLLAPFASWLPYQMLLAPRQPRPRFEDDGPSCSALLHDALGRLARLRRGSPPLNLWVRTAPRGAEHFCWRIDILPRIGSLAGLELGTGVHLNSVAPERAASELSSA
jgi:UDPglucose--hexose-1-phosphate uridylyltransferase